MKEFCIEERGTPFRILAYSRLLRALESIAPQLGKAQDIPGGEFSEIEACLNFIQFKGVIDQSMKGRGGYRDSNGLTMPDDYVRLMLPGLILYREESDRVFDIAPEFVIGCPWRGYTEPNNPYELMGRLNTSDLNSNEFAKYMQLGDLPVYIANEGKNRVELFLKHNKKIRAEITPYLLRKDIKLFRGLQGENWIASWFNEYGVQIGAAIPYPSVSVPIYRLCGTKITRERLFVPERKIAESLNSTMKDLECRVAIP